MSTPQYTEQQAQLLYDVLVHHSAATLAPVFDKLAAKELDLALTVLRMELSSFIADGFYTEDSESYDDDRHSQAWLDSYY
jgi:hypothetical protein